MYESLIPAAIQSFSYYESHIPLFLRSSYGYIEHFRIWYDLLMSEGGIVPQFDHILRMMDIFNEHYLEWLYELDPSGQHCDILDKLGSLFDVSRYVHVEYWDNGDKSEDLTLSNEELLILIKGQIVKNYCQGSREQIDWYYDNAGLKILSVGNPDPLDVMTCKLLLVDDPSSPYSSNIRKMFLAGLLNVYQLGVRYDYEIISLSANAFTWDSNTSGERWDEGGWWM